MAGRRDRSRRALAEVTPRACGAASAAGPGDGPSEAVRRDRSIGALPEVTLRVCGAASEAGPSEPVRRDRPCEAVRRDRSVRRRGTLLALALLAACGRPPELTGAELEVAAGTLWHSRCANCHGVDGRGDGPTGRNLRARPRDFHDAAWQASVDDDRLRRVIVEGGAAHGLSADMAANTDLDDRPATVDALVRIVRGFREAP